MEEEEGGTDLAALARMERGMGFSSKSMSSTSSSFWETSGEEFLGSRRRELLLLLLRFRSLATWWRRVMAAPLCSDTPMPSWRRW